MERMFERLKIEKLEERKRNIVEKKTQTHNNIDTYIDIHSKINL